MTWKAAAIYILQQNQKNGEFVPMHYRDITNAILENDLVANGGQTPANTVSTTLTKNKDVFEGLGDGEYRLTKKGESFVIEDKAVSNCKIGTLEDKINHPSTNHPPQTIIQSFGMFWMRDGINWNQNPKLLGVQSSGATPIDLSAMRGIYMLYDGREVIYVGQAIDQPILKRLVQHTKNRLATRWNRFSWFSIDAVNSKGEVVKIGNTITTDISNLANALEGILIEGLEPRQNRRQGDNFGFEYYQKIDEVVRKTKLFSELQQLMN